MTTIHGFMFTNGEFKQYQMRSARPNSKFDTITFYRNRGFQDEVSIIIKILSIFILSSGNVKFVRVCVTICGTLRDSVGEKIVKSTKCVLS